MRKLKLAVALLASVSCLLCSCTSTNPNPPDPIKPDPPQPVVIKVEDIFFNLSKTALDVGETTEIKNLIVNPTNATHKEVTFSSSNSSVAKVNGYTVEAIGVGKAQIIGTVTNQPEISYKVNLEVMDRHVKSVELSLSKTEIEVGEISVVTVDILPENALNKNYSIIANPSNVVSINGNEITALQIGYTYINAVSEDGYVSSNNVLLKVNSMTARGISLTCDKTSLTVNEKANLSWNVEPESVSDKQVLFKTQSGNTNVISISSDGVVTAKGIGEDYAVAYMKNKPEVFNKIKFTVVAIPATGLNVSAESTEIEVLVTSQIIWEVLPADATDKAVSFATKSGNNNIIKVSKTGLVTGVAIGTDSVVCSLTNNPSIKKEIEFTVVETPAGEVIVDEDDVSMLMNTTHQIQAKVLPENATDKALSYISIDRNDYSDKGERFESGIDYSYDFAKPVMLNETINLDISFDKAESKQKITFMLGQGWSQYYGYFSVYTDGTLETNYDGVSISEISDGMFRVSFDLPNVTKLNDKPAPNECINLLFIKGGWSLASGSVKVNREIRNDLLSVSSTGLVTALSPGEQTVRVYLTNHPAIYKDVTFSIGVNPLDPIGDDVYEDF